MRGFDVRTNLILSDCVEREFSDDGVEMVPLGLYMIKGDNVYVREAAELINSALIGEMDDDKDGSIDWSEIKAQPLAEIHH